MSKKTHNRKHGAVQSVIGQTIVCTNVSTDVAKQIDALAAVEGISRSDLIRSAVIREVAFRSYIKERDIASSAIGGGFNYGTEAKSKAYADQVAVAYKAFNAAMALNAGN
jgi:metal-responsive CopG/Arc/MetJ family transcriptional regulator